MKIRIQGIYDQGSAIMIESALVVSGFLKKISQVEIRLKVILLDFQTALEAESSGVPLTSVEVDGS